jgi:ankyrin repeat protein
MEEYILNIKNYYPNKLLKLPILTKEQIKSLENPYRIYFYCFYNYIDKLKKYYLWSKDINKLYIIAANRGYIKILKYLESRGLDIYLKNNGFMSSYLCACSNKVIDPKKSLKTLKYLESRGHNIYIKDINNNNAYNYALINNNLLLVKYLNGRGFKTNLNIDIYQSNIKIVNYIKRQIKLQLNRMRMVFIFVWGRQNSLGRGQNSLGSPK